MHEPAQDLLNEAVIAELFALADTPESRGMVREMFEGLYPAAQAELAALTAGGDPAAVPAQLHRLKGMMANYGFAACARLLAQWEEEGGAVTAADRGATLRALVAATKAELVRRHPWLG